MTYSDFTKWIEQRVALKHSDITDIQIFVDSANGNKVYNVGWLQLMGDTLFIHTEVNEKSESQPEEKKKLEPIICEMPKDAQIDELKQAVKYYRELAQSYETTIVHLCKAIEIKGDIY